MGLIGQIEEELYEAKQEVTRLKGELAEAKKGRVGSIDRDFLGNLVRHTWVEWAKIQPNPKPSWLLPWDSLAEPDKEVDRLIGEAIVNICVSPELLKAEAALAALQLEWTNERPTVEGWYWREWMGDVVKVMIEIRMFNNVLQARSWNGWIPVKHERWNGRWAGPIPMPKEPFPTPQHG